jgi:hypothetical protein
LTTNLNAVKKILTLNLLRIIALFVLAVGALASLYFTLHAGHNNKSVLLVALFVVWVLSPFVALIAAHPIYRLRPPVIRGTLYCLMLVVTLGSLVGYSGALTPAGAKPAGVFLVVPLLSWLLMAIVIPIALSRSRMNKQ